MIDVSIVIVCMNNLKNLYPCLDSIKKYTTVSYETLVVAYLFSKENLERVKKDYPWVTFIESNEIRGFSENNNLALRQAKGKYCFVLNDDTYFDMPVIDELNNTIRLLPENVAIVSPTTLNRDGTIQRCGKPHYNMLSYIWGHLKLLSFVQKGSKYINQKGIFKTWNISGAAFLIKTNIFKDVGWFDERYFFCPEDIALSELLNKKGYTCYVNSDIKLTHVGGGTWSKLLPATRPAAEKGGLYFYASNNTFLKIMYITISITFSSFYCLYWLAKFSFNKSEKNRIFYKSYVNTIKAMTSSQTPKEIFTKYYLEIKAQK